MADRIYVGNGKEKTFDGGGSIVTITVDIDSLINACKDYGFTTEGGKRKIKLKVGRRREVDQYGNSHLVEVDTWKPGTAQNTPAGTGYQNRAQNASATPSGSSTSLPTREDEERELFSDSIPF